MTAWDGVPEQPERGLAHQLENQRGDVRFVALWCEQDQMWAFPDGTMHGPSRVTHLRYLGPCLTPAEVAAKVLAEREACAGVAFHAWQDPTAEADPDYIPRVIRSQPAPSGADALAAMLAQARREGIEAAAAVADRHGHAMYLDTKLSAYGEGSCDTSDMIASAIRALLPEGGKGDE